MCHKKGTFWLLLLSTTTALPNYLSSFLPSFPSLRRRLNARGPRLKEWEEGGGRREKEKEEEEGKRPN